MDLDNSLDLRAVMAKVKFKSTKISFFCSNNMNLQHEVKFTSSLLLATCHCKLIRSLKDF